MEYLLRGTNMLGDPVEVHVRTCWRCGALVDLTAMLMESHVDRCHPAGLDAAPEPVARHALREDRRPPT